VSGNKNKAFRMRKALFLLPDTDIREEVHGDLHVEQATMAEEFV